MLVSHGTGHHILRTQPEDSNEADAWLLTIALLLAPHEIHSLTPAEIIRRAYLPERIAREALIELRGCFPEAC